MEEGDTSIGTVTVVRLEAGENIGFYRLGATVTNQNSKYDIEVEEGTLTIVAAPPVDPDEPSPPTDPENPGEKNTYISYPSGTIIVSDLDDYKIGTNADMLRLDLSTAPSPVEVSAHTFGSVKNSSGTNLIMNKAYFKFQIGFVLDPMDETEVTLDELEELYGNKDTWNSIFSRFSVSLNQGYSIASTTTNIGTLDINCASFSDYYLGNVNTGGSFTPGFEFIFESTSNLPTEILQPEDAISIEALIEYTVINEQFAIYLSNKNILPLVIIYYELIY